MARDDYKDGWGVVDDQGLSIRSISDTRRAAIINWLVTEAGEPITCFHSDDHINAIWDAKRGEAAVRPVRMYVQ